jgi:hypothetical protein
MLLFLTAESRSEDTIKYDGPNNSGFGHPGGGTFYSAVRFHPVQSCTLKSIIFYQYQPVTAPVWIYLHEEGSPITPGQKIDSISYLGLPGPSSWIRLNFSTPHFRAGGVDFWINIKLTPTAGQTPLGVDAGPSVVPAHSFVSVNDTTWKSLLNAGQNKNFNIRAIVRYIQPINDIGIDEIVSPSYLNPPSSTMTPIARVKNYGLTGVTNFPVVCSILGAGGVVRYTTTVTCGAIASGDTARVTFTPWTPTITELMTVIMRTRLIGDEVPANDREVLIMTYNYGYYEDFEFGNGGYIPDPLTGGWYWQPGFWSTGTYQDNANWKLNSVVFYATMNNPVLRFWHWYDMEQNYYGGNVKISTDGGATWTLVYPVGGYPGRADSSNAAIPGEFCYTGTSGGWLEATFNLPVVTGQQFYVRWHFGSDASISYPGWYIDEVTGIGFFAPQWSGMAEGKTSNLPQTSILNPAKPNPVTNGLSRISFSIAEPSKVTLKIYDASGRLVKTLVNEFKSSGVYSVTWNCRDDYNRKVAEGVYFYTLETPKQQFCRKMVVVQN